MLRSFIALSVLAVAFGSAHAPVLAAEASVASSSTLAMDGGDEENKPHVQAKDAGSIDGEVVSVDYRTNRMTVRSAGQTYDVTVLPSTDFRGRTNTFRGITDIKRGARVNVMLSQREQTLTAQIIYLL